MNETIDQVLNEVITNNKKNNKKNKKNNKKNNNIYINFSYCSGKEKDCKLTKKEICQAISHHYMVRANIIAAITTVVPKRVGNELQGSA